MDPKLPPTLLPPPPPPSHASSSYASFPILAISILGILTTAILLLSYYIFITKCCLHWRRPRLLLLLFHRRTLRHSSTVIPTTTTAHHSPIETHGLDLPTINSIPTLRFKANPTTTTPAVVECAVCLSEFQHQQLLRLLPNCSHSFHVDCIDTWLQSNDNCPLCRAQIQPYLSSIFPPQPLPLPPRPTEAVVEIDSPVRVTSKMRRESRGDEWIDTREKVQPIRRSFSMDSCNDRQLYVSVQDILRRNPGLFGEERHAEDSCSSSSNGGGSGRIRRSLFSFGRSSTRSASVLPI